MARPTTTPTHRERTFGVDELFFSTTDRKGVITSWNDVFVRVSAHPPESLKGAAHNIIRHPEMPRAVFKLIWDYLLADKPVAGYVKNMAADGGYYWVTALIVPITGGFLSVRLKPTTELLPIVRDLYGQMTAEERRVSQITGDWREGMRAGGALLGPALQSLGFASYDDFMHTALAAELAARRRLLQGRADTASRTDYSAHPLGRTYRDCVAIDKQLDQLFGRVEAFLEAIKNLEQKSAFLLKLADTIHLVSLNALIASCRLEQGGGGLSTVTQELGAQTSESTTTISDMTNRLLELTSALRHTAFSITAAKLQVEMTLFFLRELMGAWEGDDHVEDQSHRRDDVDTLIRSCAGSTSDVVASIAPAQALLLPLTRLQDQLDSDLRRLSSVHVIGKVEAARVSDSGHFNDLLDSIFHQLAQARSELQELSDGITFLRSSLPTFERAGQTVGGMVQAVAA